MTRKSIMIMEPPKNENKPNIDVESSSTRRSSRISSAAATASMKATAVQELSSPESEKPRPRRSIAKPMR